MKQHRPSARNMYPGHQDQAREKRNGRQTRKKAVNQDFLHVIARENNFYPDWFLYRKLPVEYFFFFLCSYKAKQIHQKFYKKRLLILIEPITAIVKELVNKRHSCNNNSNNSDKRCFHTNLDGYTKQFR